MKFEVHLEWIGKSRFKAKARDFIVYIDQTKEEGGENRGFKPTELLLASLAGCFATNLIKIMRFRGINFSKLNITATIKQNEFHLKIDTDAEITDEIINYAKETCKISGFLEEKCSVKVYRN